MKRFASTALAVVAMTAMFTSTTQAAEFIRESAANNGSSIQVKLSEQDLAQYALSIHLDGQMEYANQELLPVTLVVAWEGGEELVFDGPQYFKYESIPMAPLRDAGLDVLELRVVTTEPYGFRISIPEQDVWVEFRLKGDVGWVFSQPIVSTDFPVWDTTMTEWYHDLTLFLPETLTETDTLVVQFDHSENSGIGPAILDWKFRNGLYTLEIGEDGVLKIPMDEILWHGGGGVENIVIKMPFGGNTKTGWMWYTATIPETGQTAIAVHSGFAFRTWYADHKPDDPIAYILSLTEEKTAVEVTSWGQLKRSLR